MSASKPISLYIHMPWCIKKCPYCDFNSHNLKSELPEQKYIEALWQDLLQHRSILETRPIQSIFFGGGTPSLFSGKALGTLLRQLMGEFQLQPNIEITLEANPGTIEHDSFSQYRQAGINRISLGVQSFNDTHLNQLGRIHRAEAVQQSIAQLHTLQWQNFNLDIMFGLPKQTEQEALDDLQCAIEANPAHLSWYQLTLEPNTLFYNSPPQLPSSDRCANMQQLGQQYIAKHGYTQYEISAYSKAQQQCRHNLNYWQFGDYLGIGAGAHSKLTDPVTHAVTRLVKFKQPKRYLQSPSASIQHEEQVTQSDLLFEYLLNHLRLFQPVYFSSMQRSTQLTITEIKAKLQIASDKKLISIEKNCFSVTTLGRQYLNDLTALFLPASPKTTQPI